MVTQKKKPGVVPLWINATAGCTAGAVSAIFTNPLDVVKTRLQVQQGNRGYSGTLHALKVIYSQEGFRGYYHGLNTALLSLVPNWMIYFTLYTESKRMFGAILGKEETPVVHILSAMSAGASTNIITNPLWVLKTRFQTQTIGGKDPKYSGILQGFARIWKEEGIKGMYRGLGPSLLGIIHVGVQFPLYEALKKFFCERAKKNLIDIEFFPLIASAAVSKAVASAVAYPHEVLRSRLQYQGGQFKYSNLPGAIKTIIKEEGIRGLYGGMGTNLVRTVPTCIITFLVYEEVRKELIKRNVTQ